MIAAQVGTVDVALIATLIALAILGAAAVIVAVLTGPPPDDDEFTDIEQLNRNIEARAAMARATRTEHHQP